MEIIRMGSPGDASKEDSIALSILPDFRSMLLKGQSNVCLKLVRKPVLLTKEYS